MGETADPVSSNRGGAETALAAVRREIASIDPNLNLFRVRSMNDQIAETVSYLRIAVSVYAAMGIFALINTRTDTLLMAMLLGR